ncbi:putative leader peptide [Pseudonocardia nematodicida]|uniref:putative leader peptide n=1 Tax=Pseudonocardia nematodicida TaxID=1206997 RepID=UPI003D7AD95D
MTCPDRSAPCPTRRNTVTAIPTPRVGFPGAPGYGRPMTGSALLTTREHIDLARVASALCRP